MVPLNVLALQLGHVEMQIVTLTERIREHHALHHGADAVHLDVARMQLEDAAQRVDIAAEQVRRVRVDAEKSALTMTPNEVMRQVEARA